ncbi:MAG: deoxyribonuclease V [Chloroflexi bacterium]|nr:deoxyribonuclease V [Chloroflexota bacterium]
MKARELHPWGVSRAEAEAIQARLASLVIQRDEVGSVRLVAGADLAASRDRSSARGAVVVLSYPSLALAEVQTVEGEVDFPYIPGLLSFRETPLLLEAFAKLRVTPDLLLVDGQGLAHPRRFGLACHVGLLLDLPTIGCAKSRLVGEHAPLGPEAGAWAELVHKGEKVGLALRTKEGAKPLYISIGHRVSLEAAQNWTLACCLGRRLPEPCRLAHQATGALKP